MVKGQPACIGTRIAMAAARNVEMTVDGKSPLSINYQVMRQREDVSAQAMLSIDDEALGSFQGPTFNYRPAGPARARCGRGSATTPARPA